MRNIIKLIMFKLLFSLLLTVIKTTNASDPDLAQISQVTLRILDQHQNAITKYTFSDDQKKTVMTCVLKRTGTLDEGNSTYEFILNFNRDHYYEMGKIVSLLPRSKVNISRTFNFHKNDKEVVCSAMYFAQRLITKVRLEYTPPNEKTRQDHKPLKRLQLPPHLSPKVFEDSGNPFVVFTCMTQSRPALLSWLQVKGFERVLIRSVVPTANETHSFLNKTLAESDHDTEVFCAVRYFQDGHLTDEIESNSVHLSLNKRIIGIGPDHTSNSNNFSSAVLFGVTGAVVSVALIIIFALLVAMLWYRKRVKLLERDENIRERPPLAPPPPYDLQQFGVDDNLKETLKMPAEDVYEQVYGHGAGLKRPAKIRPTEAALKQ